MLPPNETLEGIRPAEIFAGMVAELPWPSLKNYILANSQLSKSCQLGGYRLEPKHRKRFESLLLKEAEKAEHSTTFCNPIFAQWYPVHETLYRKLEDYFHSAEYKGYREANQLAEDAYALPPEKFDAYYSVEDWEKWRILLCFSPLQFTKEQAERLAKGEGGNELLLKRTKELDAQLAAARADKARLEAELERARGQAASGGDELQELRKARRELAADRDALANKFEASQTENRKLRQTLTEKEEAAQAIVSRATGEFATEKSRLTATLDRTEKEVGEWRSRYEQQCQETRTLKNRLAQAEADLAQERLRLQQRDKAVTELQNFADLVLKRLDWIQAGKSLRLTPELQKQFNSVMKKLHYESGVPSLDTTLPEFWNGLAAAEQALVAQVAHSNTLEVAHGAAEDFWNSLKEPFDDVVIGLEARLMLLKLLREIFFQTLAATDLEAPRLPAFAGAKK
ncbi:MAG: hypothetical protein WC789_02250 [Lentisphaeria bacterium]|jgi:predicted nuclease with TOPRIM domain